jgi:lipase chaperone LimK
VPYLFDPKAEQLIDAMLETHGFETYAAWANAAHSIGIAMEAASFGNVEDLGSQKDAARKDIEADKSLSDEDKAKAIEELESQFAALAEFEPLPGNREAVQPYLARLRAANGG